MKKVLVVAPHADDETLGCGGTLLKHYDEGDEIYWLIVTSMSLESGFSESQVQHRQLEIEKVNDLYGFKGLYQLGFPPASLDTIAKKDIVNENFMAERHLIVHEVMGRNSGWLTAFTANVYYNELYQRNINLPDTFNKRRYIIYSFSFR